MKMMHKMIFAALMLAAVLSLRGEGEATTSFSSFDIPNVVGVTKIESAAEYLPLVVQYGKVGVYANAPINNSCLVTNLVFTGNLREGDMLYAYDHAKKAYRAFSLGEDKKWAAVSVYSAAMTNATDSLVAKENVNIDVTQSWGYGFWLHRPDIGVGDRTDTRVYLAGQVPVGAIKVNVAPSIKDGNTTTVGKTLMGNPGNVAWSISDINSAINDAKGTPVAFDTIQFDTNPATIFQYSVNSKTKEGSWKKKIGNLNSDAIPAGRSFWYQRAKAGTEALQITFPAVLDHPQVWLTE